MLNSDNNGNKEKAKIKTIEKPTEEDVKNWGAHSTYALLYTVAEQQYPVFMASKEGEEYLHKLHEKVKSQAGKQTVEGIFSALNAQMSVIKQAEIEKRLMDEEIQKEEEAIKKEEEAIRANEETIKKRKEALKKGRETLAKSMASLKKRKATEALQEKQLKARLKKQKQVEVIRFKVDEGCLK